MNDSDRQNGETTSTNVPSSAAQPTATAKGGMRLSYTRSQPHGRSSRRFNPSANIDQSASATVGTPIPPAASKLIAMASTPAPSATPGTGNQRQSGAEEHRNGPAHAQNQPSVKEVAFEKIQAAEDHNQCPAAEPGTGHQPGHLAGGASRPGSSKRCPGFAAEAAFACRDCRRESRVVRRSSGLSCFRTLGPSTFQSPSARAATTANSAQNPAVAHTSRNRLCGSRISSLDSGSLYFR